MNTSPPELQRLLLAAEYARASRDLVLCHPRLPFNHEEDRTLLDNRHWRKLRRRIRHRALYASIVSRSPVSRIPR